MILNFKAYSRRNKDIEEVLRCGHLRGHSANEPILVFGNTIAESEYNLRAIYSTIHKFIMKDIDLRQGSFVIEVDDMIGIVIKEKYGLKE